MTCTAPTAIANGVIITSGPYADGDHAVFRCNSGYLMSGTSYITCSLPADTWTASPSCAASSSNTVTVNDSTSYNFPDWLVYFIAALCGIIALAVITCLLVCCLQLFGCYGAGGLFGEHKGCVCCGRNKSRYERRCTIVPRKYEYDEDGRRFHYDDLGRRCYYQHRNRYIKSTTAITPESEPNGKMSYVTVSEVQVEKKHVPPQAKEPVNVWKPHANPIRNINTSTK